MKRHNPIVRPILIVLFGYMLMFGGTFNGMLYPVLGRLSLILVALVAVVILGLHLLRGWRWYLSPLDVVFPLWFAAILISMAANAGDWRRIAIGFWYVCLYALLWFILHDLIANRVVKKAMLVDALLVCTSVVIVAGYLQLYEAAMSGLRYSSFFGLPRTTSIMGNPNSLATVLILIIGLSGGRAIGLQSRFWRILLILDLLLALGLLFLTYSRGGWLGGAAALMMLALGWLWTRDLLRPAHLRDTVRNLPRPLKIGLMAGLLAAFAGAGVLGVLTFQSFSQQGRTAELRTYLWDVAVQMFRDQPLTGRGLFTYGKAQETIVSIPPLTPHSHAHNLPLQVFGELGLIGGAVMLFTIVLIVNYGWRSARALNSTEHTTSVIGSSSSHGVFIAGLSVMVGYGVHLLFDTTVMMPVIAITGLIAILIVTAPLQPVPLKPAFNRAFTGFYALGAVVLLAVGFRSNAVYGDYMDIVTLGVQTDDYASAADQLARITESEPNLMVYHWKRGILYGLSAADADNAADAERQARSALAAFEQTVKLEPQNALLWANIAGLYRQLGEADAALQAYRQASDLAPRSWQLALAWAQYAEASGDITQARLAYARVISASPTAALHPAVVASSTAAPLIDGLALDGFDLMARHYFAGDFEAALSVWDNMPGTARTPRFYVLRALVANAQEDARGAAAFLSQAESRVYADDNESPRWIELGHALLENDTQQLEALRQPPVIQNGGTTPVTIFRAQLLRSALTVQALPQVGYELLDPIMRRLLEEA